MESEDTINSVSDALELLFGKPIEDCTQTDRKCDDQEDCTGSLKKIICNGIDNYGESVGAKYRFPMGIWFRGQACFDWDLEPSVFRKFKPADSSGECYDEASITYQFMLSNPECEQGRSTTFDWLCHMQHYRYPTRLLDWTESLLVALLHAVTEPLLENPDKNKGKDGALFVLNARRLNSHTRLSSNRNDIAVPDSADVMIRSEMALSRNIRDLYFNLRKRSNFEVLMETLGRRYGLGVDDKIFKKIMDRFKKKLQLPIAVFPRRLGQRMRLQQSVFAVWGGCNEADISDDWPSWGNMEKLNKECTDHKQSFLLKYKIPSGKKAKIRIDLERLGIHAAAIFPEIESHAPFMSGRWRRKINAK